MIGSSDLSCCVRLPLPEMPRSILLGTLESGGMSLSQPTNAKLAPASKIEAMKTFMRALIECRAEGCRVTIGGWLRFPRAGAVFRIYGFFLGDPSGIRCRRYDFRGTPASRLPQCSFPNGDGG